MRRNGNYSEEVAVAASHLKEERDYWLKQLSGGTKSGFAYDYPHAVGNGTVKMGSVGFRLEGELFSRLMKLCNQSDVRLYMVLLTGWYVLLGKYSGSGDIMVGSPILKQDIEGELINSVLALRTQLCGHMTFKELLLSVRQTVVEAVNHQNYPFEMILHQLNIPASRVNAALFDTVVLLENIHDLRYSLHIQPAITCSFHRHDCTIEGTAAYNAALYEEGSINRIMAHFRAVLETALVDVNVRLSAIPILSAEEQLELLQRFNRTEADFPGHQTIHALFADQVGRTPDRIALVESMDHLTYRRLDQQANRLANYLREEKGVGPEAMVGILVENSIDLVAAVLGVLKSGAAYVPLEPSAPEQRLKRVIDDAAIRLIISRKRHIRTLNRLQWACTSFHTFICTDSRDIYGECEVEENELMDEKLWTYVVETATDDITGGGWLNSYDGRPFSRREMDEYGDNILTKLTPYLHPRMRVLEIGCASGISMYRIAPKVGLYVGTDLCRAMIEENRQRVKEEGHSNIVLACLPAHQVGQLAERQFDLVILNSVIQSFPGHNYLRRVLRQVVTLLAEEGRIFIGDVMDQALKGALVAEMVRFKWANTGRGSAAASRTRTDWSSELFVSRLFFEDLLVEIPQFTGAFISDKIFTVENELTRFRYDCLLEVDRGGGPEAVKRRKGSIRQKHRYQEDACLLDRFAVTMGSQYGDPHHPAYVIYTSGTTGQPRGVLVEHRSLVNYVCWGIKEYLDRRHSDLLFPLHTPLSFDLTVTSIYLPLLSGNTVAVYGVGEGEERFPLLAAIRHSRADVVKATPSHLKMLQPTTVAQDRRVKKMIVGGEELESRLARRIYDLFGGGEARREGEGGIGLEIYNEYGPTEATVGCMIHAFDPAGDTRQGVPIGRPIDNVKIYLLDRDLNPVPAGAVGEIYIGGRSLARGYVNLPELTARRFIDNPFVAGEKIYRSGDLAVRLSPSGYIEFLGRVDEQVKIRGYRVETKEIENRLLRFEGIKDAVVLVKQDDEGGDDGYLCAYLVAAGADVGEGEGEISAVREYLAAHLPEYMIPTHFVRLDKIPLTANGKVNRKALPKPKSAGPAEAFVAPVDEVEAKLLEIWAEVLRMEKQECSVTANFFHLGGHSLRATIVISLIHRAFQVKVPLAEIFKTPTIRGLADYIRAARTGIYEGIRPVEQREYYPQSSAQRRLFFLDQFEDIATSYNAPSVLKIQGSVETVEKERYEETFRKVIRRHETLRTAFDLIHDQPVQRVHRQVDFKIDDLTIKKQDDKITETDIQQAIQSFIQPFDLSVPPLLRAALAPLGNDETLLLFDMHHIICDGTSMGVLIDDFVRIHNGETLPPLKVQYKEFSSWQNHLFESGRIEEQQAYWLNRYRDSDEIPRLNLPTDYPRPQVMNFLGESLDFRLESSDTRALRALCSQQGVTLYISLLTVLNILLYRYSGQADVIVGSAIAGRPHADLQRIIGMFINMLAMRNRVDEEKSFLAFLGEVKENTLQAFENQDVQFEELIDQLDLERDTSRNPLFSVSFVVQNMETASVKGGLKGAVLSPYRFERGTSIFDISWHAFETVDEICFKLIYYARLFKPETIERLSRHFLRLISRVVTNPQLRIGDIDILSEEEKLKLLHQFNVHHWQEEPLLAPDSAVAELFCRQAARRPGHTAVVWQDRSLSYEELDRRSRQLAAYLFDHRQVRRDEGVGILMESSISAVEAIWGILKAGGAYVPLDPSWPQERLRQVIDDGGIGVVISQKRHIKTLNRLQWECRSLHTFLCPDSEDIYSEEELEKNELMDRELWEYVGESAEDDIGAGGWNSSYTGEPFSAEEMAEYGDNVLAKLKPLLGKERRVLEIGCASGLTMYRLLPRVGYYCGTDLSRVIIEKNRERVLREGHGNISLWPLAAHELDRLDEGDFDIVILNSVIQNFHGHNYLRRVIGLCLDSMPEQGVIFVGDVMDQALKGSLIAELESFKQAHRDESYRTFTDFSSALFVGRSFFEDLRVEFAAISRVEMSRKLYTIENELTKFRYDALLWVDKSGGHVKHVKHKYQHDRRVLEAYGSSKGRPVALPQVSCSDLAYVIYTSGSSGLPKGVMIEQRGVVNLVSGLNESVYRRYSGGLRVAMLSPLIFDASVKQVFSALLLGHQLHPVGEATRRDGEALLSFYRRNSIDVSDGTPSHLRIFLEVRDGSAGDLTLPVKNFLIGGEVLPVETAARFLERMCMRDVVITNVYGPTECSVDTTLFEVSLADIGDLARVPIGRPLSGMSVRILGAGDRLQPIGVAGELCVGGLGLARGYLNAPQLTARKFITGPATSASPGHQPLTPKSQILYRSGDLARWLADGTIEFLGRLDAQVKIRGYRIELAEIERVLAGHADVSEAVVLVSGDGGEGGGELSAYVVSRRPFDVTELREYVLRELPVYMVPSYFVRLERLPVTGSGKVDRRVLRRLKGEPAAAEMGRSAPRSGVEAQLVEIWSQVLDIEPGRIGLDDDFFELGGHSLKATILVARIHRQLDVKVPIAEIFRSPTIKELAPFIVHQKRSIYEDIKPVEKKEYYPQSSAQKRLFFLHQVEGIGTSYNMPEVFHITGRPDKEGYDAAFHTLIGRHESLRTAFAVIAGEPVQRVFDGVEFHIEEIPVMVEYGDVQSEVDGWIKVFVRPFDLSRAPLLRAGIVDIPGDEFLLLVDMHHIIADGTSLSILIDEFLQLYRRETLPPLKIQYKDFARWQDDLFREGTIKAQEAYWLRLYGDGDGIPTLSLPTDFPRGDAFDFAGDSYQFELAGDEAGRFRQLGRGVGATLYMNLLAAFNVLLYKYSGQEDIIIGSGIAGRPHADLTSVIGMFVNTLALRNHPRDQKSYLEFLEEVKQQSIMAFENQDVQFEQLVERLGLGRDLSRNPLFSVELNVQNFQFPSGREQSDTPGAAEGGTISLSRYGNRTAKFDLILYAVESGDTIHFFLEYATTLFKRATIEKLAHRYLEILRQVGDNPHIKLRDISLSYQLRAARADTVAVDFRV